MCDEYDDERMWAFWRRLEVEDGLRREEREVENVELPLATPVSGTPETTMARRQALRH